MENNMKMASYGVIYIRSFMKIVAGVEVILNIQNVQSAG
jgi:hypothetical protein